MPKRSIVIICTVLIIGMFLGYAGTTIQPSHTTASRSGESADSDATESVNKTTNVPMHPAAADPHKLSAMPLTAGEMKTKPASVKEKISNVPKLYQTDYPHTKFGNGTIRTSGCSITCLAMVATYLTGQEYYPDQMAYHFGSYGKDHIERLEYANAQMQLPNVRTDDVMDVLAALEEGKIVIAMMGEDSKFTTEQHFIVLTGLNERGNIIVHDPQEPKHEADVYMTNGFQNGFKPYDIMGGFSGAWIYDKDAMPDSPYLYDASMPETQENRYMGLKLTDEDTQKLASFLWLEARDEPEEVQQAIAEVILNRVVSNKFPPTVHAVLFKGEFFRTMKNYAYAKPDYPQYRAVEAALNGPYIIPSDVFYCSVWETRGDVWDKLGSYTFLCSR